MRTEWIGALASLALCACSHSSGDGDLGSLGLEVTDAPFAHDIVREAHVGLSALRIHREANGESGFETLYEGEPLDFDLSRLTNGMTKGAGRYDLPPGTYRQLRIEIANASLTLENGNVYRTEDDTLRIASQGASGFKIYIDPPLEVVTQVSTSLLLDFDLPKSFHPLPAHDALNAHRYLLQPVIHVSNRTETGEIRGLVTAADPSGGQVAVGGATVHLFVPGELDRVNSLATTGTGADGAYALLGIAPGVYDVLVTSGELAGRVDGQQVFAANATLVDVVLE